MKLVLTGHGVLSPFIPACFPLSQMLPGRQVELSEKKIPDRQRNAARLVSPADTSRYPDVEAVVLYGTTANPRVHPSVGYTPFLEKKKALQKKRTSSREILPKAPSLHVLERVGYTTGEITADGSIVGFGGRRLHIGSQTGRIGRKCCGRTRAALEYPSKFNDDEVDIGIPSILRTGRLKAVRDFRFQVFPGQLASVGPPLSTMPFVFEDFLDYILDKWIDEFRYRHRSRARYPTVQKIFQAACISPTRPS